MGIFIFVLFLPSECGRVCFNTLAYLLMPDDAHDLRWPGLDRNRHRYEILTGDAIFYHRGSLIGIFGFFP